MTSELVFCDSFPKQTPTADGSHFGQRGRSIYGRLALVKFTLMQMRMATVPFQPKKRMRYSPRLPKSFKNDIAPNRSSHGRRLKATELRGRPQVLYNTGRNRLSGAAPRSSCRVNTVSENRFFQLSFTDINGLPHSLSDFADKKGNRNSP